MQLGNNEKSILQIVSFIESYLRDNSVGDAYRRWLERYSVLVSDRDDQFLFEKMVQAMFSGGMSGFVVDEKMPSMGVVFDNWDPAKIAEYSPGTLERKTGASGVIRHKGKSHNKSNFTIAILLNATHGSRTQFGTTFIRGKQSIKSKSTILLPMKTGSTIQLISRQLDEKP